MAATVTIDKAYFETLLRRAELHATSQDLTTPVSLPVVSIPKADHDNLSRMAQEYTALRDALYRGGISPDTIEILIRGDTAPQGPTQADSDNVNGPSNDVDFTVSPPNPTLSRISGITSEKSKESGYTRDKGGFYSRQYSFGRDDRSFPSEPDKDEHDCPPSRNDKPFYNRAEQRTIIASNLSDRTTHKDLVNVVRGGALLNIYLRANDRSASISFIEGSAAQNFMNYIKRKDVYIHGKRVEFAWNDRQFVLPGHVANKISIGATRNLIIRGVHPNITEKKIREDLDHIHNLIIISISYQSGDARLSLNSINNGLFARTCMMSRAMYKGMKIEWYPDECALPLPRQQWVPKKENVPQPIRKPNAALNRFQLLNMDGTEDGSDNASEEDTSDDIMLSEAMSPMDLKHRSPWNPTVPV